MATHFKVDDYEDFLEMAQRKDFSIAKAVVDAILDNLDTEKKHIHVFEIEVENEDTIYDLTVEQENFVDALEKNLIHYEREELYEECSKIVDAIEFLKTKING